MTESLKREIKKMKSIINPDPEEMIHIHLYLHPIFFSEEEKEQARREGLTRTDENGQEWLARVI